MAFLLYSNGVFLLYSKDDINNKELEELMIDIKQDQNMIIKQNNDFQWDNTTKQTILVCDIFICCLSKKFFESKLIDMVKFTYCIARKKINTIYLEYKEELEEMMKNDIQEMEEQISLLKKKDPLQDKDKKLIKECILARILLEANHNFFRLKTIEYSIDQIKKVNIFFINSSASLKSPKHKIISFGIMLDKKNSNII